MDGLTEPKQLFIVKSEINTNSICILRDSLLATDDSITSKLWRCSGTRYQVKKNETRESWRRSSHQTILQYGIRHNYRMKPLIGHYSVYGKNKFNSEPILKTKEK